jgi:hypothetical protein
LATAAHVEVPGRGVGVTGDGLRSASEPVTTFQLAITSLDVTPAIVGFGRDSRVFTALTPADSIPNWYVTASPFDVGRGRRVKNPVNQATEEDLVQRTFAVDFPNVLWLSDIVERPGGPPKMASPCS